MSDATPADHGPYAGEQSPEAANLRAWTTYGQHQLDRGYRPEDAVQIRWSGQSGNWPGTAVLGDISGKRLLDIGCGSGHYAAHLARDHHAQVDAIDISPSQHRRATTQYGHVDGVRFLLGDVVDHLARCEPYDLVYSVHGLSYLDPHRSLPAIHHALRPYGRLVFSVLHTDLHRQPPSSSVEPRQLQVRLKDLDPLDVHLWVLAPQLWEDVLTDHGFLVEVIRPLHRSGDDPVIDQLVHARRR